MLTRAPHDMRRSPDRPPLRAVNHWPMTTILQPTTEAPRGFVLEKTALEVYVPPAKPSLVGLSRAALADALGTISVPEKQRKMRIAQLWNWIYVRGVTRFDQMTSVSKDLRTALDQHFTLE